MQTKKILIIDYDRATRYFLRERLEHEGYTVETVEQYDCTHHYDEDPNCQMIVCDELTIEAASKKPLPRVNIIVLVHTAECSSIVRMLKLGVFSVLSRKPLDINVFRDTIKEAFDSPYIDKFSVSASVEASTPTRRRPSKSQEIVGQTKEIKHVQWVIDKVAPINARVLITGENGTGKELVAHQLHMRSSRASKPFIEVNCAAIPSELIESELFGHEKGSFTSAIKLRKGKFEQAEGGTLFLDEIGDMSLSAQAKVLRVLQESKISRVGSDKDIVVDVRVVAATNKNLPEEIKRGNFREDLYHRLSTVVIMVPSLNDRAEDIPLLANYFLNVLTKEYALPKKRLTDEAVRVLCEKRWSGNIRELRNVMERLVIFCDEEVTEKDVKQFAYDR